MQQNFIGELENRGKKNIESKEKRIMDLLNEENNLIISNASIEEDVFKLTKEIEGTEGATEKLRTLGNLKEKSLKKYLPLLKNTNSSLNIRYALHVSRISKKSFV